MSKQIMEQWVLYYPESQIKEPVICELGRRFNIITNIFHFNVLPHLPDKIPHGDPDRFSATAVIEVDGEEAELIKAKEFLASVGIKYESHKIP